ncbi:hypothetical protein L9F63_018798 [Diploptera punctata]|uniref:Uncharacterized protein n=1 Tax=Diploptera punctata TaxID=6984 RepID=A0AAD8EFG6_DIPPU|nr:hypothetical protein L9F63_018798 [Diploptera punctata]
MPGAVSGKTSGNYKPQDHGQQPRNLLQDHHSNSGHSDDDDDDTVLPPQKQVGAERNEQMQLLYGKATPMIMGMETAMQLSFDRNRDLKQPKLWPNIPLKL